MIDLTPGQRVQLKYAPERKGTVTRVSNGTFAVTFDGHGRKSGVPRQRYSYQWSCASNFEDETFEEVRILEDDL